MIETVHETGSTNADLVARLARGDHVPEGMWLVSDRQSAGRGRLGREWKDGLGNFMGSTVVHVRPGDPPAATLALVAGLAVYEVIAPRLAERALLKWPNDVLVADSKLAGILLERAGAHVVVGIGVNLVSAPHIPGRQTTSLAAVGHPMSRDSFATALAGEFATDLDRWRNFGLGSVISRWMTAGHKVGTRLQADEEGEQLQGTFAGLTEDGALQLRLASGALRVIHGGEIRIA